MRVSVATTLVPGLDLVGPLERAQSAVTVLRRVEDTAELLAVARSGTVDALLLAGDLTPLTRGLLTELDALARPVGLVAVSEVSADRGRARALGVRTLCADVAPLELADELVAAARDAQTGQRHLREVDERPQDDAEPLPRGLADADPLASADAPDGAADVPDGGGAKSDASVPRADRGAVPGVAAIPPVQENRTGAGDAPDGESTGAGGSGEPSAGGSSGAIGTGTDSTAAPTAAVDEADGPGATERPEGSASPGHASRPGRVTAVWGPAGAPGRTTVAANLAAEAAVHGSRVLLVDADTYGPAVGVMLGLTDESAGLAQAARDADLGRLDRVALERATVQVRAAGADLGVLTGLTRPERWPELRGPALDEVLRCARECHDEVVVDVGFCLEEDEELSFDVPAPQRNGATLAALRAADRILAVGAGDAVGLPRLMRGVEALREAVPEGPAPTVVVNRVRSAASGTAPQSQITQVWRRFGPGLPIVACLPADPAACDRALLGGQLLAEAAPKSPLRTALRDLAAPDADRRTERGDGPASQRSPLRRFGDAVAATLRPRRRRPTAVEDRAAADATAGVARRGSDGGVGTQD